MATASKIRRVEVGRYTYETDLDVEVGDVVLLPVPEWFQHVKGKTWEGTVTSLTSNYTGPCARILGILEKAPPPLDLAAAKPPEALRLHLHRVEQDMAKARPGLRARSEATFREAVQVLQRLQEKRDHLAAALAAVDPAFALQELRARLAKAEEYVATATRNAELVPADLRDDVLPMVQRIKDERDKLSAELRAAEAQQPPQSAPYSPSSPETTQAPPEASAAVLGQPVASGGYP